MFEAWVAINWLFSLIGCIYSAKKDSFPMFFGWLACFIGWYMLG